MLLLIVCSGPVGHAEDAEVIRERARSVVSGDRYQRDLEFTGTRGAHDDLDRDSTSEGLSRRTWSVLRTFGDIAGAALYILLAVVGVLFVVWIVRMMEERSTRSAGGLPATDLTGQRTGGRIRPGEMPATPVDHLTQAERLASEGRYGDAVHSLLLGAIRHVSESTGAQRDSLTSRELARQLSLDDGQRRAFLDLVLTVEAFLFGRRTLSRDVFEGCKKRAAVVIGGAA